MQTGKGHSSKEVINNSKKTSKPMLWLAMVSMAMFFAGLTSAYKVSHSREDWVSFDMPEAFWWSSLVIVLSSFTFYLAQKKAKQGKQKKTTIALWATLALGLGFVFFQLRGFEELIDLGFYFTGEKSTISSSFVYALVFAHLAHLSGGLIVLLVIIYNNYRKHYTATQTQGLELGAIFWHFLDILWVYLFFFLYFIR